MLTLTDEVDVSRGDLFAALSDARPQLSDQFAADLVWMDSEPMLPGRQYLLKSMTRIVPVQVTELKYRSRRRHARAQRREGAGAERDRLRQSLRRRADRLRSLLPRTARPAASS